MSGIIGGTRSRSGVLDLINNPTFGGVSTFPAGSATAPSITWDGDTNTGLFSPGADHVGITTGGTRRLKVDGSGETQLEGTGLSDPRIGDSCEAYLTTGCSGCTTTFHPTGYTQQHNSNTGMFEVGTYGIKTKIAGYYLVNQQNYTASASTQGYVENYLWRRDASNTETIQSVAYTIFTRTDAEYSAGWYIDSASYIIDAPLNAWYRCAGYVQNGSINLNAGSTQLTFSFLKS